MFHELVVEFLELLERVLIVLTGTLRQDVHAEVSVSHFLLVRLLVGCTELVSLALKFLLKKENGGVISRYSYKMFEFKLGGLILT